MGKGSGLIDGVPTDHRHRPARPGESAQYSRAPIFNRSTLEYWITRFRG